MVYISKDIYKEIQEFLKLKGLYTGKIDGIIGPKTNNAIADYLKKPNWSTARLLNAMEQTIYKEAGIETGPIDGLFGPSTEYAREVWETGDFDWRDRISPPRATPIPSSGVATLWPLERDLTAFYGEKGTNQVDCILPFRMYIAWDISQIITKYKCHKLVKEPMERIWNRTLQHYGLDKIHELRLDMFGGCLNVRKKRGSTTQWSVHSWGVAVDIDPALNQLRWGRDKASLAKPVYDKFWEIVYDEGAISLGREYNYDWMHWQFARS